MKDLAFILKGRTFCRSLGPLIYFSNKCGIKPIILYLEERPGKPYDSLGDGEFFKKTRIVKESLSDFQIVKCKDEKEIIDVLKALKVENVCCQDGQSHHQDIVKDGSFKVFSISAFFDTIHNTRESKKLQNIPFKTYFPNSMLENLFKQKSGLYDINCASLGSPWFDHSLFVKTHERDFRTVLFLCPDHRSIKQCFFDEISDFSKYCNQNNIKFLYKERVKAPWPINIPGASAKIHQETGFPYSSIQILMNTDIHITSYGTSIFESLFLEKPAINLEIDEDGDWTKLILKELEPLIVKEGYDNAPINQAKGANLNGVDYSSKYLIKNNLSTIGDLLRHQYAIKTFGLNHEVKKLQLDELYNNEKCTTISKNLIESFEEINPKIDVTDPNKVSVTFEDNNSIKILEDILREI